METVSDRWQRRKFQDRVVWEVKKVCVCTGQCSFQFLREWDILNSILPNIFTNANGFVNSEKLAFFSSTQALCFWQLMNKNSERCLSLPGLCSYITRFLENTIQLSEPKSPHTQNVSLSGSPNPCLPPAQVCGCVLGESFTGSSVTVFSPFNIKIQFHFKSELFFLELIWCN